TVAKKPGRRGEHEVTGKTIARGVSGDPDVTVVTMLACSFICMRGCGCIVRPAFPAPSDLSKGRRPGKTRAVRAARLWGCVPRTMRCLTIKSVAPLASD